MRTCTICKKDIIAKGRTSLSGFVCKECKSKNSVAPVVETVKPVTIPPSDASLAASG